MKVDSLGAAIEVVVRVCHDLIVETAVHVRGPTSIRLVPVPFQVSKVEIGELRWLGAHEVINAELIK